MIKLSEARIRKINGKRTLIKCGCLIPHNVHVVWAVDAALRKRQALDIVYLQPMRRCEKCLYFPWYTVKVGGK